MEAAKSTSDKNSLTVVYMRAIKIVRGTALIWMHLSFYKISVTETVGDILQPERYLLKYKLILSSKTLRSAYQTVILLIVHLNFIVLLSIDSTSGPVIAPVLGLTIA